MDKIIPIIQIRFLKITHSFLFYLYMIPMHEVVPSAVSAAVMMLASTWRASLHTSLFFIIYLLSHLVLTCGLGVKVVRFESILFPLSTFLFPLSLRLKAPAPRP